MANKAAPPRLIDDKPVHRSRFAANGTATVPAAARQTRMRKINPLLLKPHEVEEPSRHAPENVTELMESIRAVGLEVPPLVWERGSGDYVILAGHRRVKAYLLLAAQQAVPPKMEVRVISDITNREAIYLIAAEAYHSEGFSPVQDARVVGRVYEELQKELGTEPSGREVARFIPAGRNAQGKKTDNSSAVQQALTIYRALQDPRLADLVRSADGAGKKTLYAILRCPDVETQRDALALAGAGKTGEAKRLIKKRSEPEPRPRAVVRRTKCDNGFRAKIHIHSAAPPAALLAAAAQLEKIAAEVRSYADS